MTVALNLPDLVAAKLGQAGADVAEEMLRTLVCGLYREGRISTPEAMRSLNITSRAAFETLVAHHHAEREWPDEEIELELATIKRLND